MWTAWHNTHVRQKTDEAGNNNNHLKHYDDLSGKAKGFGYSVDGPPKDASNQNKKQQGKQEAEDFHEYVIGSAA